MQSHTPLNMTEAFMDVGTGRLGSRPSHRLNETVNPS